MCNLAGKVFIDARRGRRGGSNKGVVITKSNYHGNAGIRISISEDSVKMLGQGVERVIPAIHPDFENRLYIYDASQVDGCIGFKLTKAGSRRCFRVEAMGKTPSYSTLSVATHLNATSTMMFTSHLIQETEGGLNHDITHL